MGVVALKIKGGCKLSARMSNEIKETTQDKFQGNLTTRPSPCKSRCNPLNERAFRKSFHCAYLR